MKMTPLIAAAIALGVPAAAYATADCCKDMTCCKDDADCCKDDKRDCCKDMRKGVDRRGPDTGHTPAPAR